MIDLLIFLGLITLGAYLNLLGVYVYRGRYRRAFVYLHSYSGALNYASIPSGIMLILLGITSILPILDEQKMIISGVALLIGFVALILNFVQPESMTPKCIGYKLRV